MHGVWSVRSVRGPRTPRQWQRQRSHFSAATKPLCHWRAWFRQWHAISQALAEPPRRRLSQVSGYFDFDAATRATPCDAVTRQGNRLSGITQVVSSE